MTDKWLEYNLKHVFLRKPIRDISPFHKFCRSSYILLCLFVSFTGLKHSNMKRQNKRDEMSLMGFRVFHDQLFFTVLLISAVLAPVLSHVLTKRAAVSCIRSSVVSYSYINPRFMCASMKFSRWTLLVEVRQAEHLISKWSWKQKQVPVETQLSPSAVCQGKIEHGHSVASTLTVVSCTKHGIKDWSKINKHFNIVSLQCLSFI